MSVRSFHSFAHIPSGLCCHSGKALCPHPGPAGPLCPGCSSLPDCICKCPPVLLPHPAPAALASQLLLGHPTRSSHKLPLKLLCPLLFAWLASPLQVSSQMMSYEKGLPDHPIENSPRTVFLGSLPLSCLTAPHGTTSSGCHICLSGWLPAGARAP